MQLSMDNAQLDKAALLDPNAGSVINGKRNFDSTFAGEEGLTVFTAILAMISTIIGGGIVGLPFSFFWFGIPLAILLNLVVVLLTSLSARLYLATKDLIPDKPESLYEI